MQQDQASVARRQVLTELEGCLEALDDARFFDHSVLPTEAWGDHQKIALRAWSDATYRAVARAYRAIEGVTGTTRYGVNARQERRAVLDADKRKAAKDAIAAGIGALEQETGG
jgi:hypothetical protein